jgi:hypothetical protein
VLCEIPSVNLSDNLKFPSPLMGEGRVGVKMNKNAPTVASFPLPFIPSRQGRGGHLSEYLFRGICQAQLLLARTGIETEGKASASVKW